MDIKMSGCSGLEAIRFIKAEIPEIKIVILTVSDEDEDLFEAIKSGADGYLSKNIKAEEFFAFLAGAVKGETAISPLLATKIIEEFARQSTREVEPHPSENELTERERPMC